MQGFVGVVGLEREPGLLEAERLAVEVASAEQPRQGGGVDRIGIRPGILRHVTQAAAAEHHSAGGLDIAGEDLQEACLTGAVAADEADFVPVAQQKAAVLDDGAGCDFHGEIVCLEHGTGIVPSRDN